VNLRPITGNLILFTSPDGGETISPLISVVHCSGGSRIAGTYSLFALRNFLGRQIRAVTQNREINAWVSTPVL